MSEERIDYRLKRFLQRVPLCCMLVLISVAFCGVCVSQSPGNPFVTEARFAVDSEADASSAPAERLHPRLALTSVVAMIGPDPLETGGKEIEIHFFSFPLAALDKAHAREGKLVPLIKKSDEIQNQRAKSKAPYNGGGWAEVRLGVDKNLRLDAMRVTVPGYTILLGGPDLQKFIADYRFDGKELRLKSKGSHRVDHMPAGVASFTLNWDVQLGVPVFAKAKAER